MEKSGVELFIAYHEATEVVNGYLGRGDEHQEGEKECSAAEFDASVEFLMRVKQRLLDGEFGYLCIEDPATGIGVTLEGGDILSYVDTLPTEDEIRELHEQRAGTPASTSIEPRKPDAEGTTPANPRRSPGLLGPT